MFYADTRPKGVIILFHGFTADTAEISSLATHLCELGYDVCAPCLAGHGTTATDLAVVPMWRWVQDAEEVFRYQCNKDYDYTFVVGSSFGSLLTLYLAQQFKARINAIALISVPYRLRNLLWEYGLFLLSCLPDHLLNRLGLRLKRGRNVKLYVEPRVTYDHHSYGALARMVKLRRQVVSAMSKLGCPAMVLQDPEDDYLASAVPDLIKSDAFNTRVIQRLFPHGKHALTIGPFQQEVFEAIGTFFDTIRHGEAQ